MASFSKALKELKKGKRYQREGWNGKGMYVLLIKGDSIIKAINMTYGTGVEEDEGIEVKDALYLKTADDKLIAWNVSQDDALATDWQPYFPPPQGTFKTDKILKALESHEGTLKDFLVNNSLKQVNYGRIAGHTEALKEFIKSRPDETFIVITPRQVQFKESKYDTFPNVMGRGSLGCSCDWIVLDGQPRREVYDEIRKSYDVNSYATDKTKIIQLGS